MSDPRTEKARLADDLEALRIMVSQAPNPICDIAGDTLARAIAAVEKHMPDGEVETFDMWCIQDRGNEAQDWILDLSTLSDTEGDAWSAISTGQAIDRCNVIEVLIRAIEVRVTVTAPTGEGV